MLYLYVISQVIVLGYSVYIVHYSVIKCYIKVDKNWGPNYRLIRQTNTNTSGSELLLRAQGCGLNTPPIFVAVQQSLTRRYFRFLAIAILVNKIIHWQTNALTN